MVESDLVAAFTPLDPHDVVDIMREHWDMRVHEVLRLDTERDDTFASTNTLGDRHVLKVSNPVDERAVIDLQTRALLHAHAVDPGLPLQPLVPTRDGSTEVVVGSIDGQRIGRLFSYLPGYVLDHRATTPEQRRSLGRTIGRLTAAMTDFDHPMADRRLDWDVARLNELSLHLVHVDRALRADVGAAVAEFADRGSDLATVRRQVVHGDANPNNVLVNPASTEFVSGILDFGDVVRTLTVVEAANAIAYAVVPTADPWAGPSDVLAGYVEAFPLTEAEVSLTPTLVRARLAQRVLLNSWMVHAQPANAAYTGRNIAPAAAALRALLAVQDPGWT